MKNTNAINTEQHIQLEQIGSFFVEKERELRAAMAQVEKNAANVPAFFSAKATGKLFVSGSDRPLVSFFGSDSEDFEKRDCLRLSVDSGLFVEADYREEVLDLCLSAHLFLWGWNDKMPIPYLDKDALRMEITLGFVSYLPSAYRPFAFEDIPRLDDRAVQKLLQKIDVEQLVTALYSAPTAVMDKISCNMSKRAAQMLKEDIEFRGDLPPSDVENAQRNIVRAVKKLEQEKEIVLPKLTYADKTEK